MSGHRPRIAVPLPGVVTLELPTDATTSQPQQLAEISELLALRSRRALVIIDARSGAVVAGGDITIGEVVVSSGLMTLAISQQAPPDSLVFGSLQMPPGVTVQEVAAALHAVAAPPESIANVFQMLQAQGALTAVVQVR